MTIRFTRAPSSGTTESSKLAPRVRPRRAASAPLSSSDVNRDTETARESIDGRTRARTPFCCTTNAVIGVPSAATNSMSAVSSSGRDAAISRTVRAGALDIGPATGDWSARNAAARASRSVSSRARQRSVEREGHLDPTAVRERGDYPSCPDRTRAGLGRGGIHRDGRLKGQRSQLRVAQTGAKSIDVIGGAHQLLLGARELAATRVDVGETHARVEDAHIARPALRQIEIRIERSLGGREIAAGERVTSVIVQQPLRIVVPRQPAAAAHAHYRAIE